MNKKLILGLLGCSLLTIGVFSPIIKIPIVGDINYYNNGKGDGLIILGLSGFSLFVILIEMYDYLILCGILSIGLIGYNFYNMQSKFSEISNGAKSQLYENQFQNLGELVIDSFQIQWGWSLLFLGSIFLLSSGFLKSDIINK